MSLLDFFRGSGDDFRSYRDVRREKRRDAVDRVLSEQRRGLYYFADQQAAIAASATDPTVRDRAAIEAERARAAADASTASTFATGGVAGAIPTATQVMTPGAAPMHDRSIWTKIGIAVVVVLSFIGLMNVEVDGAD